MNLHRLLCIGLSTSLALAGCGGGDDDNNTAPRAPTTPGDFTAVVSFGDSLSDVGTYAPATSLAGNGTAPYFGGRFTTNGPGAGAWVENLATSLGIALTPAEVGFDGRSVKCPAAAVDPSLAATCTAYAQGGARITNPVGIGHNADGSGALTVPVVTQITNHLARFGSFKNSDLVLVYAGNNDVFIDLPIYAFVDEQVQGQVASGELTAAAAAAQLAAARSAVEADVTAAATDLADAVKTMTLGRGGRYVAVMTLVDIADTPFGNAQPAPWRAELTNLSVVFNAALRSGLKDAPVQIIDSFALSKEMYADPAKFGFVDHTTPACDSARISVITGGAVDDGSSLFCNGTPGAPYNGLVAGADTITWQFADDVHPTTGGHRAIAAAFTAQLRSFGWIR
ncbi:MAG TPA: SGNH/GDSL hydrolase family protein [Caldimonas sp.]|nr:SGNH/GDSL hydrolase family protein [Caldimonas sp.]